MTVFYGQPLISEMDLRTAPTTQDVIEYDVTANWSDSGTLTADMLTDGDIIYPEANQGGNWTSFLQDVPRNRIVEATYTADMRDGNGQLIVNAWTDAPNGDPPDASETVELQSGQFTEEIGFSDYNYFRIKVHMEETAGSSNQRPSVDSLRVDYEIVNEDQVGLEKADTYILFYTLSLLAVSTFMVRLLQ